VARSTNGPNDLLLPLRPLPERLQQEITALWDEYDAATTQEAKLAKALDKLETIMQHNRGQPGRHRLPLQLGLREAVCGGRSIAIRELLDRQTA
jgi:putative hydrolase of HD superfamily